MSIKNDFVFAMTGYHPDFSFLESMGVRFEGPDKLPVCNAGDAGEQRAGDLPGRRDCGGIADQRDLYREWEISWGPDCAGASRILRCPQRFFGFPVNLRDLGFP